MKRGRTGAWKAGFGGLLVTAALVAAGSAETSGINASIAAATFHRSIPHRATVHLANGATASVTGEANSTFAPPVGCAIGKPAYSFSGSGDAPDPDIVDNLGKYFAFTTGTALGNHLQALVSSTPTTGYGPYSKQCRTSSALPTFPAWEEKNTQTSPGVYRFDNKWIMFYDASQTGYANDSGHDCISVATASTLGTADAAFTDTSTAPLLCQPTGSIDPSPMVDPTTNQAYLVWKQNDGGSAAPAYLWSQPLAATGTAFAPNSSATQLITNDTTRYPWEGTVEDPSMVDDNGTWYLLFAAGVYRSASYSEGITACSGPTGPCTGSQTQILTSYGSVLGPGGGSLFADSSGYWWIDYAAWQGGTPGCTTYSCGAARSLFVAPIALRASGPKVPCSAPETPDGYRFVASDGGLFSYGNLPFCGSMGGRTLNKPVVGMAATPSGGGYWEVATDGGLFAFGDAPFHGSMGGKPLNEPIVDLAVTPSGAGYWEVATDGGLFAFGDAPFHGSMGGHPLNKPVVGMAATPSGKGYWEVASDGGLFAFGDAPFYGSMGGKPLVAPIVGIAASPSGKGYWEVASDGGLFAFGDAPFHGSMGGKPLVAPIVGMAATTGGKGYWEVASDGGLFAFGDAPFRGSMGGKPLVKPVTGMSSVSSTPPPIA